MILECSFKLGANLDVLKEKTKRNRKKTTIYSFNSKEIHRYKLSI